MILKADLHIHSCLSPCGSLEMSPSRIVREAIQKKLDRIALTDHNTCRNIPALARSCEKTSLKYICGMEITSSEESHILAYFPNLDTAMDFDQFIYRHLPNIRNRPEILGDQVVVDEEENILEEVEKYLGNATDLSIKEIVSSVHSAGGVAVPAHISRPRFSLFSQLGGIPDEDFDALELSSYFFLNPNPQIPQNIPLLTGSDAHYPQDIGRNYTEFDFIDDFDKKKSIQISFIREIPRSLFIQGRKASPF